MQPGALSYLPGCLPSGLMAGWPRSLKGATQHCHLFHSPPSIPPKPGERCPWRVRCTRPPPLWHPLQPQLTAGLLMECAHDLKQGKTLMF